MQFIDLQTQYKKLQQNIQQRINRVMEQGQFIMGPEVQELEQQLANYVGVKYCIAVGSGTDALQVAMMALEIKPGDEVITSPFTFIATGEMILLLGAKPVFVDIDPKTYNIDPNLIEQVITPKTKAIMPVSLYGQCADMDEINAIAKRHQLPVIEDGAQSFGATYKDKKSCGLSTIGCTSFFPSKPLGCYGDGGACFTDDEQLATAMRYIRVHGQSKRYYHTTLGINSRLDTLQAAILLAKLEIFPEEVKARRQIGERYSQALMDYVQTPYIEPYNTSVYAQYTIQVDHREKLQTYLQSQGIPTAVHYPVPLNLQPIFLHLNQGKGSFIQAEAAAQRVLSLPMHAYLSEMEQRQICDAICANYSPLSCL